ncbi:SDR family oxidoreductase [Elstera cyanobacteriorum]|uniref:SDR family oxidoreductase n=1 Tax=Elstera cyanobacteriorum TaxID=2022747 RepID=UPI002356291E|nr:SDR family NAD(P)-dependent oxidoreductase [Elstera cyanobacteriorum]MCK6442704.1 SDR family oxidoreductase [Elstera cyanobacteriorum]
MTARTILITGAAKRVGAGLAKDLAAAGHRILVHYNASATEAAGVVAEIDAAGGTAWAVQADLATRDGIEALLPRARALAGPVDGLIHNASLFEFDHLNSLDWPLFDAHLTVNLAAPAFLSRDFARQPDIDSGVIIAILDQKVDNLNPDFLSYTLGKVGLKGLMRMLAMQLAPRVRVGAVSPGLTLISGRQTEDSFATAHQATPLGRGSTVADLARACRFILETESFTGQTITVDGGESLMGRARDVFFDLGGRLADLPEDQR